MVILNDKPAAKKVALFVGADVTAHIVLNKVVKDMLANGFTPVIFMAEHVPSKKADAQQFEIREMAFFERHLTNNVIYPFMEASRPNGARNLTPRHLSIKYELAFHEGVKVNDPALIQKISQDHEVVGAISIRCFQKFSEDFISKFTAKFNGAGNRFLLNLHPGKLPDFKGVLSTARAMDAGVGYYGWTLHEIDNDFDTGDILWSSLNPLNLNNSVLLNNIDMAKLGADSIKRALEALKEGNILAGVPQGALRDKNYFSYPTPKELSNWKKNGVRLVNHRQDMETIIDQFGPSNEAKRLKLTDEVLKAVGAWYVENGGDKLSGKTPGNAHLHGQGQRGLGKHSGLMPSPV